MRRAKSPRIVYELIPNLRNARFVGAELTTNRDGFRGPECPGPKTRRSLRIVGLGDSVQIAIGNIVQCCALTQLLGELSKPNAGVDLIKRRMHALSLPLGRSILVKLNSEDTARIFIPKG